MRYYRIQRYNGAYLCLNTKGYVQWTDREIDAFVTTDLHTALLVKGLAEMAYKDVTIAIVVEEVISL